MYQYSNTNLNTIDGSDQIHICLREAIELVIAEEQAQSTGLNDLLHSVNSSYSHKNSRIAAHENKDRVKRVLKKTFLSLLILNILLNGGKIDDEEDDEDIAANNANKSNGKKFFVKSNYN